MDSIVGPSPAWYAAQEGVKISVDLVAVAQQQMHFLTAVTAWYDSMAAASAAPPRGAPQIPAEETLGSVMKNAIRRYRHCWLPLLNHLQTSGAADSQADAVGGANGPPIIPPLDVHWAWHCHRLCPDAYLRDCQSIFGRVIDCPAELLTLQTSYPFSPCPWLTGSRGSSRGESSGSTPPSIGSPGPGTGRIRLLPSTRSQASRSLRSGSDSGLETADGALVSGSSSPGGSARCPRAGSVREGGEGEPEAAAWALQESRRIWSLRFPLEPYDPVLLPSLSSLFPLAEGLGSASGREVGAADIIAPGASQKEFQYDVAAACLRQLDFIHQISRPQMADTEYLVGTLERYRAFLALAKTPPTPRAGPAESVAVVLTPPLDVDFLWHCHMLCTREYLADCRALAGTLLSHDDAATSTARSAAEAWTKTYKVPYARAGALPWVGRKPEPFPYPRPPQADKLRRTPSDGGGSGTRSAASSTSNQKAASSPPSSAGASRRSGDSPRWEGPRDLGLPDRQTMEAHISLLALQGPPSTSKGELFVRISGLRCCPETALRSAKLQPTGAADVMPMADAWAVDVDLTTEGLQVELCFLAGGMLKGIKGLKILGEGKLPWKEVTARPGMLYHGTLRLRPPGGGPRAGPSFCLGLSVSTTTPSTGPVLLLVQPAPPTDNGGYQISSAYRQATKQDQEGRWMAFLAVDHEQVERLMVRVRIAKGTGGQCEEVPPDGKRVVVHKGGWTTGGKAKGVPCAGLERVEELYQLKGASMATQRTYMASSGWSLTVSLGGAPKPSAATPGSLLFLLTGLPGALAALAQGCRLEYETLAGRRAKATAEEGYATLIRYSQERPQGRATALLNWRTGGIQVAPGERYELVLVIAVLIAQAWHDLVVGQRRKGVWSKGLTRAQLAKDERWGALCAVATEAGAPQDAAAGREGAPLPWFQHSTAYWNATALYSRADVGASCALVTAASAAV